MRTMQRLALVTFGTDGAASVRVDTPVEAVVALLTDRQVRSVPVLDEYGVQVGAISMADVLAPTETVDPIFAGLARRRWYDLPAGATAGDLMLRTAPTIERILPDRVRLGAA